MRIIVLLVLLSSLLFGACTEHENAREVVTAFFDLRSEGEVNDAWELVHENSRNVISFRLFERYCFTNKVIEYSLTGSDEDVFTVNYSFYDKRFNKEDGSLHTFYVNSIDEHIRVVDGTVVFPHPLFLTLRKHIAADDIDAARKVVARMLEIAPGQKDVLLTARRLDLL